MANVKISELPAVTASSVLAGKFPLVTADGTTSSVLGSEIVNAIPDATTDTKGKLMLASTGIQDATKAPKATGAEIVSILTAGGYSLAPATGASNLDNIADGTSYKRIRAAIANQLNSFGIPVVIGVTDLYNISPYDCFFTTTSSPANAPEAAYFQGFQRAVNGDPNYKQIVMWRVNSALQYANVQNSGVWGSWRKVWDSNSDGNGGQPPAPKPTTSAIVGQWVVLATDSAGDVYLPSGGTWAYFSQYIAGAAQSDSGVQPGGTKVRSYGSNIGRVGFAWRIA